MPIPVAYNLRSARERWTSSVVAVLGIAGTVGVFVAMLALARGFKATVTSSGLPQNAIVQRSGADTEMTSILTLDDVHVVEELPQVARTADGKPLVSPEVVVIAPIPLRDTGTDANVQVRGVSPRVLGVRDNVTLVEGRFIQPGLAEAVIGKGAHNAYTGLDLGATVRIGAGTWKIVGVFDGHGTAFDSEVWADASVLDGFYQRPTNVFQSATVRLKSKDAFAAFEATLKGWRPDLILTDIHMPEAKGTDICRTLKNEYKTQDIPIVLFSSLNDDDPNARVAMQDPRADADDLGAPQ